MASKQNESVQKINMSGKLKKKIDRIKDSIRFLHNKIDEIYRIRAPFMEVRKKVNELYKNFNGKNLIYYIDDIS
jgi:hypothetical protein